MEDAQVSYELCEHASIYPDPATVADWDQEWQFLVSSYDNQNDRTYLYTVERTDIATDGSLTLRTQAEVDAFARSGINTVEGNLTIGGEDEENPVTNLDGLKNLVSVRCDLTITAAYTGETLAGLENLTACESLRIGSAAHPNETLRQLSLPALKEIKGDLCVYGTALQTADFKSLQSVAGHFVLQSDALLQLTADELTTVAGNMTLIGTTADEAKAPCEQMYFPKLQRIDGTLTLSRFDRLSGLGTTFGVLTQAGALRLRTSRSGQYVRISADRNHREHHRHRLPYFCDRSCCRHSPTPDRSKLRGVRPSKHYPSRKRSVSTATLAWQRSPRSRISGSSSGAQSHFRRPVDRRPVVARRRTGSLGMHFFSEQYARPASGRRDATDGARGGDFGGSLRIDASSLTPQPEAMPFGITGSKTSIPCGSPDSRIFPNSLLPTESCDDLTIENCGSQAPFTLSLPNLVEVRGNASLPQLRQGRRSEFGFVSPAEKRRPAALVLRRCLVVHRPRISAAGNRRQRRARSG